MSFVREILTRFTKPSLREPYKKNRNIALDRRTCSSTLEVRTSAALKSLIS
jgi:hypothetical protein